jgi:hypothetical protein
MSNIKNMTKGTGEKVGLAGGCVENTTGTDCGPAKSATDIRPHMIVLSACGCTMG